MGLFGNKDAIVGAALGAGGAPLRMRQNTSGCVHFSLSMPISGTFINFCWTFVDPCQALLKNVEFCRKTDPPMQNRIRRLFEYFVGKFSVFVSPFFSNMIIDIGGCSNICVAEPVVYLAKIPSLFGEDCATTVTQSVQR